MDKYQNKHGKTSRKISWNEVDIQNFGMNLLIK